MTVTSYLCCSFFVLIYADNMHDIVIVRLMRLTWLNDKLLTNISILIWLTLMALALANGIKK